MKIQPYISLCRRLLAVVVNWPLYLQNRFFTIKSPTITYRLRCGMKLLSRPFSIDRAALNDVWLDESYDPNHFGISFDWNKCKTILDIGANIGTFTVFAAWKAPDARIVSVEPEPGNAAMVRANIQANHLEQRVTLIEAGIAKEEGKGTLYLSHKDSGGHSLFAHETGSHPVQIPLLPLRKIFEEQRVTTCDFLKLDCEGGEYEALYNLSKTQLSSIRFIAVEYHHFSKEQTHNPTHLKAFLEEHGFTVMSPKKSIFFAYPKK